MSSGTGRRLREDHETTREHKYYTLRLMASYQEVVLVTKRLTNVRGVEGNAQQSMTDQSSKELEL